MTFSEDRSDLFDPGNVFSQLRLATIRLRFTPESQLCGSGYSGSAWRGVLGQALQKVCCTQCKVRCGHCPTAANCIYYVLYEAQGQTPGFDSPPRPYVLSPLPKQGADAGFVFTLVTGPTTRHSTQDILGQILAAVQVAGILGIGPRKTKFHLREMHIWTPGASWQAMDVADSTHFNAGFTVGELLAGAALPPTPWHVDVHTPLRTRSKGKYLDAREFSWGPAFRDFARRLAVLADLQLPAGLDEFLLNPGEESNALYWHDWHRRSSRQDKRIPMGGLRGTALITPPQGRETLWWRWWRLAEHFHLGKGTTMGLGRLRMRFLAEQSNAHKKITADRRIAS